MMEFFNRTYRFTDNGHPYEFRLSAGYATYPTQSMDFYQLCKMADQAMYHVKLHRKESFVPYSAEIAEERRGNLGLTIRDISQGVPIPLVIYTVADSEILFANQAMIEFLNCATIDDLLQYSNGKLTAIFPSDDRRKLQRNIKKFAKLPVGQHAHSTYRVTTKDGKEKQVFVTSRWMHNDHFGDIFFTSMVEQEDFLLKAGEVSKREHREIK